MSGQKKNQRPSASAARHKLGRAPGLPDLPELLTQTLFPPEHDGRPLILAIAGPNGAGKSTVFDVLQRLAGPRIPPFLNVDDLTLRLGAIFPGLPKLDDAGWAITNALRQHALQHGIPFTTEILLSDTEGQRIAALAQARAGSHNFRTVLIYVTVALPDLAVARVMHRAATGAHGFAPDVVREHYARSHEALPFALQVVDGAIVLDNSEVAQDALSMKPLLLTEKGRVSWESPTLPNHIIAVRDKLLAR